ncbi:MAG: cytochrome P450, partial [Actinomycetota bacterium]|nr:cytochrome P450 [Actinomycetota bacterium]
PRPARWLVARTEDPWAVGPAEPPSMLAVDPPDHTRYRSHVAKVFTPRALAALEPRIEQIAAELLDRLPRSSEVDLIAAYAGPLPVRVICEMLGVPAAMHEQMRAWGDAAGVTLDPAVPYRRYREAQLAVRQMHRWLADHLVALRRAPGDDLLSRLVTTVDDGRTLSDVELRATALLVIGAGFETTVNLLGNGVVQLLAHPEQREPLAADPERWPGAVDEVLRIDPPVQSTLRVAAADVEIDGHAFPSGRFVSLMLGGANRDPEVFPDPDRFDVLRANAREHLAFSAGVHFCLGAALARLEGAVGLRMLLDRFPGLAPSAPPVRRTQRVLRGYARLPVRLGG